MTCPRTEISMNTLSRLHAGELKGATRLDLCCGLTRFPEAIFELADTLEVLNLTGNALSELPADLGRLHRLRVLFCSNNRFTRLPTSVGRCESLTMVGFKANQIVEIPPEALPPQLRWLILTDNLIETLPDNLGDCTALQKLMLAGNRLGRLPQSLARCERLELLRISSNALTQLPEWLFTLPRLAWLAYAGNRLPEGYTRPGVFTPPAHIEWQRLEVEGILGEGASGVIHQARLDGLVPVAVKLYKGALTSDGSPLDEMDACVAAGEHPQLLPILGQITGHPEGASGLVMGLVASAFRNLAGPPSLASCTRDEYAQDMTFEAAQAGRLARGVASACAHLHSRGLMHGDLYAHNLLWREDGECLLTDFGAASFYPAGRSAMAAGLERIEVRAFGLLLGELLQRMQDCADLEPLWALQRACVQPHAMMRPGFEEISARLAGLGA